MNRRRRAKLGFRCRCFDLGVGLALVTACAAPPDVVAFELAHEAGGSGSSAGVEETGAQNGCEPPTEIVEIAPGESIQDVIDAYPPGRSFLLGAGIHRLQTVEPRQGDRFYGERDAACSRLAVMSGARLLTSFELSGGLYLETGQTQEGQIHGACESGWEACRYSEDLYFDDLPLQHVESQTEVGPGKWSFDYTADTIYFADDPTGHRVEISVNRVAFAPTAPDVTIVGLVIEKYAIPPQMGAIGDQSPQTGWHIESNEVRLNHGTGIVVTAGSTVLDNHIHDNGQQGVVARGADITLERNEISYNNYAHFDPRWEAGGAKFSDTTDLVVLDNCLHHNLGRGIWSGSNTIGTLYEANVIFQNWFEGILHGNESYDAIARDNWVGQNGEQHEWLWGSNILVSTSKNVSVIGNVIEVSAQFGNGIGVIWQDYGSGFESTGNDVHDNEVTFLGSAGRSGAAADFSPATTLVFEHSVFDRNRYHMPDLSQGHFAWVDGDVPFASFQSSGQEHAGTADTNVTALAWDCDMNRQ